MIISKKKYEKLNNDLVKAKAKVDDAKKALDDGNKIMRKAILIKEQRDQYKEERENFEQMLNEECERGYQMEGKYHDMKAERDTLIDDLSWYKEKVSRLERENRDLRLQSDTYFDEWQEAEKQKNNYKDIWQTLKTETLKQLDTESERLKRAEKELDNNIDNSYIIGKITGQRVELINVLLTISSLDDTNEFSNLLSDLEEE